MSYYPVKVSIEYDTGEDNVKVSFDSPETALDLQLAVAITACIIPRPECVLAGIVRFWEEWGDTDDEVPFLEEHKAFRAAADRLLKRYEASDAELAENAELS